MLGATEHGAGVGGAGWRGRGQAGGRALGPSPELASGLALPDSAFLLFWRMALLPPPALALGPPLPPPAHTSVSTATLTINSSHTPAVRGSSGFGTGSVLHVETRPTFFKICSLQVARVPKVGLGAILSALSPLPSYYGSRAKAEVLLHFTCVRGYVIQSSK